MKYIITSVLGLILLFPAWILIAVIIAAWKQSKKN